MSLVELSGKRALVTGAASGVGRAVVEHLANAGAHVTALDISAQNPFGPNVDYVEADVGSVEGWQNVAAQVATGGGLDYLHLNAGIQIAPPSAPMSEYAFESMQLERYRRMMSVNVDGVVFGLHALLPEMRSGGAVVATSSLAGITPYEVDPLYAMSKHAVSGLVRSMAGACATKGVRINAICPGGVDTNIIPHAQRSDEAVFMTPQDIADEVIMLFSTQENGKTWAKVATDKPAWIVRAPGDRSHRTPRE